MTDGPSLSTQALLLLSEPLLSSSKRAREETESTPALLTPGECRKLIAQLEALGLEVTDLFHEESLELLQQAGLDIDPERLRHLLGRRVALESVTARWREQAIWVAGLFDDDYPVRFLERAGAKGPIVCYGCGDRSLLGRERSSPSLAIVGPRDIDSARAEAAWETGRLAAEAGITIVSGGARGIDQAAMQGALKHGGWTVGVLADRLARMSAQTEAVEWIEDGQLTLISTRDPLAGFSVGHAMQRNKLIYALADVALVVGANHQRGGTWAGAVEQLRRLHYAPVYVWEDGRPDVTREALLELGAQLWPSPKSAMALREFVSAAIGQELPEAGPAV